MSMKKVYALNLTPKRITMLSGVITLLFSMFFFIGFLLGKETGVPGDHSLHEPFIENNEDLSIQEPLQEKNNTKSQSAFEKNIQKELNAMSMDNHLDEVVNPEEIHPPQKSLPKIERSAIKKNTIKKEQKNVPAKENAHVINKYYTLQIAAFIHEKDAVRLKKKLKKESIQSRVDRGIRYWFVRSMKTENKSELQDVKNRLVKMNFQPIIISQNAQ